ncbi:dihydropteroate synthase [Agrobacterium sp. ES01]|uniref:dihydropteroate synthase n=1 Tax=Agrobacterium sp. ES01 TaxID=3420714 RepID=UPI003D0BA38C
MEAAPQKLWRLAHGRSLALGGRAVVMAIVNVTPDSFSDGGRHNGVDDAVRHSLACVAEGAEIVDIGGESTRPGAAPVSPAEEQDRVLPVIEKLTRESECLISIDTYRAETARLAHMAGAHIINDVHGLQREPEIATVAAKGQAGLCIMHSGRGRDRLADVVDDQFDYLERSLEIAERAGVARSSIVLDPGFGFAKESERENVELMARFEELHRFDLPFLIGTSRKRFLGSITGREAADRDAATAATSVILRLKGAQIFRVHNVALNLDALKVADAVLALQRQN